MDTAMSWYEQAVNGTKTCHFLSIFSTSILFMLIFYEFLCTAYIQICEAYSFFFCFRLPLNNCQYVWCYGRWNLMFEVLGGSWVREIQKWNQFLGVFDYEESENEVRVVFCMTWSVYAVHTNECAFRANSGPY